MSEKITADVIVTVFGLIVLWFICNLFGLYRTECGICSVRNWAFRMETRVVSGSGPETCETDHVCRHHYEEER